jgi:hypothetical protein
MMPRPVTVKTLGAAWPLNVIQVPGVSRLHPGPVNAIHSDHPRERRQSGGQSHP